MAPAITAPQTRTSAQAAKAACLAMHAYAVGLAARMASGDRSAFNPRSVGQKFLQDIGAEANPIEEVALGFIMIGIALVIALTILPIITAKVEEVAAPTNSTGGAIENNLTDSDVTLLRLFPTVLIVGLMAGGVAFLFRGFKQIRG